MSDAHTGIPQPFIILAIFILLFRFVVPFVSVLVSLLRITLYPQQLQGLEGIAMLSPLRQVAMKELEALGFRPVMAFSATEDTSRYSGMLLRHATAPAFATLAFRARSNAGFAINFYSFGKEDTILATVNRVPGTPPFPKTEVVDACADTPQSFWQAHENRIKGRDILAPEDGEAFARIAALHQHYFAHQCATGAFIRSREGLWFPSFRTALSMTLAAMRTRRQRLKPYQTVLTSEAYQSDYYAECYREQEVVKKKIRPRPLVSMGLLAVSLAVSLGVWAWYRDWSFAAILVAVLLIHESGHALAMRVFGYRNMHMFFLPMLGAIVTGSAKNISAWKQAVILFAGPVPGLLAGIWLIDSHTAFDSHTVLRVGIIAFIVNLFNLLPITPLDGGRLVEVSLLARWPYAMLFFAGLSFFASLALAVGLKSPVGFIIAFFTFSYTVGQWRILRVRRAWKGQPEDDDKLPELFEITRRNIGNKPFMRQYFIVKAVYDSPTVNRPRLWESLSVFSLLVMLWAASAHILLRW
jgi:Zn-dependent protease